MTIRRPTSESRLWSVERLSGIPAACSDGGRVCSVALALVLVVVEGAAGVGSRAGLSAASSPVMLGAPPPLLLAPIESRRRSAGSRPSTLLP